MKKIYRISSFVLALALCALTACTKTEIDDVVMVPDGSSARVALNFNVKSSIDVTTRAAQPEYYEYLVNNIYVLIFNGNQRIELSENANDKNGNVNFFSPEEIKDYKNRLDNAGNTESSGTIEFGAISGAGLKICAIANLGVSNSITRADFDETDLQKDLNKFDAIKTYDEFKKMSISLRTNTVMRGASFVMTGEKNDVTLQAYTNESEKTEITIPLERTDSKITFNVKAANDELTDFEFVPLKWRVVNVPTVSYVLPRIESSAASTTLTENLDATVDNVTADFFSIPAEEAILFEGKVQEGETSVDNSGTFTFYMYENLKAPQKNINIEGSDAAAYALREKQAKNETSSGVTGQRYENGDYEYAPKGATYVVFTGQVSYAEKAEDEEENDRFVLADVEYSVHLGHGSNTNVNSYNTLRNHHYTYNVTVTGINDLLVEVESNNPSEGEPTDDERRPGAEGDIVMSASQIVEVDGHYDRALITLTAEEANKIFFAVSTPWERGLDTNGFLEANNTTMRDYKWVKFLIHDTNLGIKEGNLAAYPGEQCYDGGKTDTGTAFNSPAYGKDVTLRDIRQLSNYFKTNPLGENATVAITMFIDEYLYYYDPTSDPVTTPTETTYKGVTDLTSTNDKGLLLWKKSVNNEPRLMHIVKAGDMTYSADGETSLSRSVVTIKQKPIISLYNTSASDLVSAWGTETVNETPRLTVNRDRYPTQETDYYANAQINNSTKDSNGSISWADAISSTERYGLGTGYTDPSYACAMRNRDLNGDGTINQNEVLWYLAALEQMTSLWIADPIMPNDAKLYDPKNPDGYYYDRDWDADAPRKTPATHYVTSTINDSYPQVYWAEEYGASSTHYNALKWAKAPLKEEIFDTNNYPTEDNASNYGNYREYAVVSVRCLRNLGMVYTSTDKPQDFYEVEQPTTSNDGSITLPYINKGALRSAPDNGASLPYAHIDDIGENNRPFTGFFVKYSTTTGVTWNDVYRSEVSTKQEDKVCPEGYRVPNQREMLLMSQLITGNWNNNGWYAMLNGQYLSDRSSSNFGAFFYYRTDKRITRVLTTLNANGLADTKPEPDYPDNVMVRCVMDNPNAKHSSSSDFNEGGEG